MVTRSLLIAAMLAAAAMPVLAQSATPYPELRTREIKALSPEQIRDLREARGMGLSLPAELNGAPGPLHVLELRHVLAVTDAQAAEIDRIKAAMQARARALGEDIIRAEAMLEQEFKNGTPDEAAVSALTERIGVLSGRLRAAHLSAHVRTKRLLTPIQVAAYDRARGYAGSSAQPSPSDGHGQHQPGESHRHR